MLPAEPGNSESDRLNEASPGSGELSAPNLHVSFGLYEFNLQTRELRKGGYKLRIPHQSFQILAMLLERPGEVVSREHLRRKLWPGDVFVNFEASLNSAVQRLRSALQDTSLEPRYIETLPRVGYRFIASVESLTPVPEILIPEVPASEIQILNEAPSIETSDSTGAPSIETAPDQFSTVPPGKARDRLPWAAGVLVTLVVLLTAYFWYHDSRRQHFHEAQAQPALVISPRVNPSSVTRRSVAVMGFTNASGDRREGWLSTAFTEMLATELAAGDHLRTVPEEDVARARLELSLTNKDSYGSNTLTKIRKDIGCDYVVAGSYLAIGRTGSGRVRLDARVQDAVTGDTVASFAVVGSQSDLFDLASRAGEQLRAKLGVGTLTSSEAEEAKLALPSNPEAARLYSDGLAKLRLYDDVAASDLLERVIRLQPDYSPAYSALATAWSDLGFDAKATATARKAMDMAGNLPPQARLQTEARYHEMNKDWTRAAEVYSRLHRLYPDNLDYGLNLAATQDAMANSAEAAATLTALRKLPAPESDDPRIDLTEAKIAGNLADYKREQILADGAARKAEITGARLLLARARLMGGLASFFLGNLSSAVEADAVAQRMFAESGDLDRSAVASMNIGGVLATQGDIAGARHSIEQALNLFRKQGDQFRVASALSNLGEMYEIEDDLPRAENLFRESVTIFAKLNLMNQRDVVTKNLADSLEQQGKFHEAKGLLEQLLDHGGEGNKSILGTATQSLGSIAETQGDMASALRFYQEAVAVLKETGAKTDYTDAERSLGKALLREGDFAGAKQAISEALSVDRETGAKTDTARDQVALAELSLAQSEPVDVSALQSVIDQFRLQKITDGEIEAEIVLARENIQEVRTEEAAKMLGQTTVLSAKSYDPTIHFEVALATAHLRAAQHRFDDARRTIRPAMESAVTIGCVRCQLEARLELGEIEIQAGNAKLGRAQLHKLADEAGSRGFRLIASRAAADGS
jgi:DNA-binding winged helix-turn-helix (wHTH) protein/tetratricopeptide (TPR) repeat protein